MEFDEIMKRIGSNPAMFGGKDDLISRFMRRCDDDVERISVLSECFDESIHNSMGARSVRSMASDFSCSTADLPARQQQAVNFSVSSENLVQAESRARDLHHIASQDWQATSDVAYDENHGSYDDTPCSLLIADPATGRATLSPVANQEEEEEVRRQSEGAGTGGLGVGQEELYCADSLIGHSSMSEYETASLEGERVGAGSSDDSADSEQDVEKPHCAADRSHATGAEEVEGLEACNGEVEKVLQEAGRGREEEVSKDLLSKSQEELERELEWTKFALESRRQYLRSKRSKAGRRQGRDGGEAGEEIGEAAGRRRLEA
ncbi:hypothetical protein GUITHDRAFT_114404 [Guillardia theta CCMP2712]|uniref:Uncharacterized protein n=1 Tax=Guillardia theta (strain CCMP2712) TaxID=905079 RepID=L1IU65_GUITC|nr:hypothetical protein GUITHDRAFT_114404 [Guillardia theta CCMP2712]EKX39444.1 hypothetical protein GUITHDRAFT_114404 [Guillardia theta CCMP2712]|eukprot:XP_005826424.1 hypothetical protein GUITHDRAFT_114404 [Guillardia theta CCMP2712]